MKEINDLKQQNQKLLLKNENISNPNKINLETYENKLFIYENLLKETQNIIVNFKEQNKNYSKKEIKPDIDNENDNNIINNPNNKYIIEEIYVISPQRLLNTLNDKTELYEDINFKLKNLNQLIQYQSMKSIPTSQSCSNFNSKNFLKNKN